MIENSNQAETLIRVLSSKQRIALDCISINEDLGHHPRTTASLERLGLVEGYTAIWQGVRVRRYRVPTFVHIAWCRVSSEEVDRAGGIEAVEREIGNEIAERKKRRDE